MNRIETKSWRISNKRKPLLFIIFNQVIYTLKTENDDELDHLSKEFLRKKEPPASAFAIPVSYIRQVTLQEGKNDLVIYFGKNSKEHFEIDDENLKSEIFKCLSSLIPDSREETKKNSILRAGKNPLITIILLSFLFFISYGIASDLDEGYVYEARGAGIATLVLFLAKLGHQKIILIFSVLLMSAIIAFFYLVTHRPVISRISRSKK